MRFWPASPSSRTVEIDPDQIGTVASGTMITVDRLSRQVQPSRVRQVQSPGRWALDVTELNCKLRAAGALAPQCVAVLFVIRANGSVICGVPLEDGEIVVLPEGCEIEASILPGIAYSGAVLPAALWSTIQQAATGMPIGEAPSRPVVVRVGRDQARMINSALAGLVELLSVSAATPGGEAPPAAYTGFLASLCEASAIAQDEYEAIDRSTRTRLLQAWRAEAFIRANIRDDIPILGLCCEMGISRRQLEYAFRSTFDVSPHEFIHLLRLNLVRRELMSARGSGLTATSIALDWGINHLGRFSTSYRSLFGESPSETLRGINAPGMGRESFPMPARPEI